MSKPEQQTAVTRRKTIQLTSAPGPDGSPPAVFALCDDGTIWMAVIGKLDWVKVDEPPQPDPFCVDDATVPRDRDCMPICNRCGNNDNVVIVYGTVDDDNNLPAEVEHDHKVPFNCLHCGREWFGSFVTPEKPESDQ